MISYSPQTHSILEYNKARGVAIRTFLFYALVTFVFIGMLCIAYNEYSLLDSNPQTIRQNCSSESLTLTINTTTTVSPIKQPVLSDTLDIPEIYKIPIPRKAHMPCQSYHEINGISFDQLWEYPPVSVFIGIFTIATKFERRQVIRDLYRAQQKTLIDDRVEYRFIMGKPDSPHLQLRLEIEQEAYGDLLILNITENLNKGKGHAYWKWAAKTFAGIPENKSLLIAKADDDVFIHFQNLALNLRPLAPEYLYYGHERKKKGGGWRTGLMFILSMDYIEWIGKTEIPKRFIKGPEDVRVWDWLRWGNLPKTTWVNEDCLLYQDPRSTEKRHSWLHKDYAGPQTIGMHGLKKSFMWDGVIDLFFGKNQFTD
ncbi:7855_t:CDS:2 [Paraglomus brasilianum]|uniref:Hexosyltransferase n=1 Tax=Paraglomus brasilianum TaxID=144538 RepID=A0A9N9AIC0_9GLOM|nr:7855_t:CDS:2 [Paraglomus brasilianum]